MSTALLAGVLLGVAACGTNGATPQETPTAANVSSPTPAVATITKVATCAALMTDLTALKAESLAIFATVVKAATDPSLEAKALDDIKAMYAKMQTTVAGHLATAGDPELKAAMTTFIDQIKIHQTELAAAGGDLEKAVDGLDNPATEAANDKLEALCS